MRKIYYILLFIPFCVIWESCRNTSSTKNVEAELFYEPMFAQGFYLEKKDNDKILHMFNPWQGAEDKEFVYRLYPRGDSAGTSSLFDIPVPVQKVVCLSTTHIAYIDALKKISTIVGISGAGYVSNDSVQNYYKEGKIKDIGYESSLAYELVVSMQPDVVFAYGVDGEITTVVKRLNELGIPVVYLSDYLEEHPLGRAEYVMAVAAFYNCEEEAFEQFDAIVASYLNLCEQVQDEENRPKVMLNSPWGDVWYFPGKHNYMTLLLRDAAAEPVMESKNERNSESLSIEKAYVYAMQAEYWLHPGATRSLSALKANDVRFAKIPAFINKKVYNNTRCQTAGGGSDFWESGVMNPHIILRDLVKIFHPDVLPEHELVYYEQLK